MKALILVGGYGTRLRPLTLTIPKPMVDFGDKSILCHQIEALLKVGVKEIILAVCYQPNDMIEYLKDYEEKYGVKLTFSLEKEPLGTAGPLKLAEELICQDNHEGLFFVFNSDIICDYPLQDLIYFHKSHGAEGTIIVTEVQDPSKYGVIVAKDNGEVKQFVEKPQVFLSNKINAGLYLFNTSILKRIENKPTSIEREIFPLMSKDGQIYQFILKGFWMDIGQPKDYLVGQNFYLESQIKSGKLKSGSNIKGNVMIHPTAKVDETCEIGPNVVIGENCVVGQGCRIYNSTIMSNTTIKGYGLIEGSIIGWKNQIGKWVRINGLSVTGEDVIIKNEVLLTGIMVLPHKSIDKNYTQPGTVVM